MGKASPIQSDFSGGEFSPRMYGRPELERYRTGLAECKNFVVSPTGHLTRRPGTKFVAESKSAGTLPRLIPFQFSTEQAYILEFGPLYIRFYRDQGQILSSGIPYEIATPYSLTDIPQLKFTQSADIMYITHPDWFPRKLTRTGHTAWTLTSLQYKNLDGPYLDINATTTTLTPGAATGVTTLTASAVTGINNDTGFQVTDIGRVVRLREGTTWGWGYISNWTSTTVVEITIYSTLTNTNPKTFWRLGAWSGTTGFPSCSVFHENRLCYAGIPDYPLRIDLSESGNYESFKPTELDGSVVANDAISATLNSNGVNAVRWLLSDEKSLMAGTVEGEWIIRPSSLSEALSPTNVTARQSTAYGSADIQAIKAGRAGIFSQRGSGNIRELSYFSDVDGYRAVNLSELADHLLKSNAAVVPQSNPSTEVLSDITGVAYQKSPHPILWVVRNDGVLLGLTYERDIDLLRAGWHRHYLGGESNVEVMWDTYTFSTAFDYASYPEFPLNDEYGHVVSVAVIPSTDGRRDEVWLCVRRKINGRVANHIEFMTPFFSEVKNIRNAFFVDSGLSLDNVVESGGFASVSKATPGVVTTNYSHGLTEGDKIYITDVAGMSELNQQTFLAANVTSTTFELQNVDGDDVDTTEYGDFLVGGIIRKYVSTLSGLDHLEGETVQVFADGAVQNSKTVVAGSITLDSQAVTAHVGLGYNSDLKQLRLDAGAADGTSIGKTRRIHTMGIMLDKSIGLKVGFDFDEMDPIPFRKPSDPTDAPVPLFSGIKFEHVAADYDMENQFCVRQDQPLPTTILALMPQIVTQVNS